MSGSFQWPGPAYLRKPSCRSRMCNTPYSCHWPSWSIMPSNLAKMSPVVRQDWPMPFAQVHGLLVAPFAQTEKDGASGGAQGVAHFLVGCGSLQAVDVAPVVFEIIHSPRRVGLGVLHFVVPAAGPAAASVPARIRIDAELQSLGMDVVGQRLDAGGEPCRISQNVSRASRCCACQRSSMLTYW